MITPPHTPEAHQPHIEAGHSVYVWLVAMAGALGGLLFGYDWVVIGGAKPFYERYFHLNSPELIGWAMSCALVGCLVGALSSGTLSNHFGRKRLLILAAFVFVVSSLGTGLATVFPAFVVWRITGGYAIGLASGISPMYIAEISPAHLRGRLVSLNQLAIVSGILLAQIVNWLIARPVPPAFTAHDILVSWNGQWGWRWMFGVTAIPAACFLIASLLVPESPRWLATKGRTHQAFQVLDRLGGGAYAQQVLDDFSATSPEQTGSFRFADLFADGMGKILFLGVALAVLQQWCGINVIFNYAQEIFAAAGYHVSDLLFEIVFTGAVNLAFTFVALFTIDRLGRRVLLLTGISGLVIIYAVLGTLYHLHVHGKPMLALVLGAIACYSVSLAPVTWVIIAEIFPTRIRGSAMSIAVTALWTGSFTLTYAFPLMNAALKASGTFWVYALICLVGLVYLAVSLPETKGQSLEEIEARLRKHAVHETT